MYDAVARYLCFIPNECFFISFLNGFSCFYNIWLVVNFSRKKGGITREKCGVFVRQHCSFSSQKGFWTVKVRSWPQLKQDVSR